MIGVFWAVKTCGVFSLWLKTQQYIQKAILQHWEDWKQDFEMSDLFGEQVFEVSDLFGEKDFEVSDLFGEQDFEIADLFGVQDFELFNFLWSYPTLQHGTLRYKG